MVLTKIKMEILSLEAKSLRALGIKARLDKKRGLIYLPDTTDNNIKKINEHNKNSVFKNQKFIRVTNKK